MSKKLKYLTLLLCVFCWTESGFVYYLMHKARMQHPYVFNYPPPPPFRCYQGMTLQPGQECYMSLGFSSH